MTTGLVPHPGRLRAAARPLGSWRASLELDGLFLKRWEKRERCQRAKALLRASVAKVATGIPAAIALWGKERRFERRGRLEEGFQPRTQPPHIEGREQRCARSISYHLPCKEIAYGTACVIAATTKTSPCRSLLAKDEALPISAFVSAADGSEPSAISCCGHGAPPDLLRACRSQR